LDKSNVCILGEYGNPYNDTNLLFDKYSFSIVVGNVN